MILQFCAELVELGLIVASLYLGFSAFARRDWPAWLTPVAKRRHAIVLVLALAIATFEVVMGVLDGGAGPIDEALMWFIHDHVPGSWIGVFDAITLTGSYKVMLPLTAAATIALWWKRHRFEALLFGASLIFGALVIFVVKGLVARDRPALWEADWYWGSSFPSGHTLAVAVFATAAVMCVRRLWPERGHVAAWTALVWIALVALSRLVLGVHWPSDVMAAACIGSCIPIVISVGLEWRRVPEA